ncbi:hypothetical protein GCM10012290_18790 [Halolactibacillus alkaliphilus]|uniref:DUF4268 domain-containing protein n=1 Tax=Halolactibacillus alkaliphilus TaxID=442899 RepID=A0A511X2M6_9BACI|nr:DUF4268 domain-containing protein [Halolactibacillus alkaliphilus]GEN57199.1 hypothetical protein HAL01_16630 [Halolactibacillus alkaliphilus]GGN72631.1 hypothetical protein GCM10012290_18790 [Halolactibacillus alkaliphilus]SFO90910.1 Uncharacterized conserved protein, contains ParB-like and HNH nuclease domains [Halolactibacillus alkaliphilus]
MGDLQSLSDLFQNKLFRIPDYQRGYAWKQSQLIDFWDDVMNLQEDRYHYTGLLSLKAVPKSESIGWGNDKWLLDSGFKAYHVVDGQQRLTTFSILMNEIVSFAKGLDINAEKNEDEVVICFQTLKSIRSKYISQKRPPQNIITTYLFGYEIDNPSAEYLTYKIYEEPHSGTINETYYTKNLKYAKEFFIDCLNKLFDSEGLDGIENLYRKLTLQLMFNIHEIEDDYDVFVAFETMNNRGKKLTNLELLKNRLIYLTTLYDDVQLDVIDKDELRKQINDAWKEVYYQLGRNQNAPLSDDEFLRAHWIMYFHYSRKKGDDYIKFLLNKFSAKNIFEKQVVAIDEEIPEVIEDEVDEDDDSIQNLENDIPIEISKLKPNEIRSYVNSLKDVAKYWFYTHFPEQSELTNEEKIWLERLNRIGIGYFRPIVTISLVPELNISPKDRVEFFKAVERFIFLSFRMAAFQSSYKSSDYYRKARALYMREIEISEVTKSLTETATYDMDYAIKNFITRIDKRFSNGDGFYGWRDLRYFLYEYEFEKALLTGIEKLGWKPFTKVEKDKVTIEHILPQTPTKWYWRNQFRQFDEEEIKTLSASLGNLLPLSQSVNSSLQNDSFEDKKSSNTKGRRGYEDGSHSEIEVSHHSEWNAKSILDRGMKMLRFLEKRWNVYFDNEEQMLELLHLEFVNDVREEVPELPLEIIAPGMVDITNGGSSVSTSDLQLDFWTNFVNYCAEIGRTDDIGSRKPLRQNWYDVSIGKTGYHVFLNIIGKSTLRIGLYIYSGEVFTKLEENKETIEQVCGFNLEWYTSRKTSVHKRVLYSTTTDLYDKSKYQESFNWLITHFDKLKEALDAVD